MLFRLAHRMLTEPSPRLLWNFAWNFGWRSMRAIRLHEKRLRQGVCFPPFLFISITNSCQLRCQGCWVDVDRPRRMIELAELDRIVSQAKQHGNHFFGLLGGEPLLHPHLLDLLRKHRDCYFQIFTNGHLLTDELAGELARIGNATVLISIEGNEIVSDRRRGQAGVFEKTLAGLENCRRHRLITGVATSVCQSNCDLLSESWLRRLIELGVHYAWFYTYRPIGANPSPELALSAEQIVAMRRLIVQMRRKLPIVIVDAYWDADGRAMCPMAIGMSHHIGPGGDIEPCPIIQFARENVSDSDDLYGLITGSKFLDDFRRTSASATRGCVILERPELVKQIVDRHGAHDTTQRGTALAELDAMTPRTSQHVVGGDVPEDHWVYRLAKKRWFFGFGAYS